MVWKRRVCPPPGYRYWWEKNAGTWAERIEKYGWFPKPYYGRVQAQLHDCPGALFPINKRMISESIVDVRNFPTPDLTLRQFLIWYGPLFSGFFCCAGYLRLCTMLGNSEAKGSSVRSEICNSRGMSDFRGRS